MKIVIAVEEFDPDKGYLEYHLAKELTNLGHHVYVFTFGLSDSTVRAIEYEGFKAFSLPYLASMSGYHLPNPISIAYILKFLRAERPDIVHCQPLDSPLSLVFISWSRLFRYKVVGTILSQLNFIFSPWDTTKKILFYLSKIIVAQYALKKSEIVFAKSNELMKLISRSYDVPTSKFHVIPLGTDPELFKFNSKARVIIRKKLNLSESDIVTVYSGKIDPSKCLDLLINALSPIMTQNAKVKLLIIGTGKLSYIKYLEKLISDRKISSNVIFQSWVHRKKLPDFYSASDIAVWPGLSSISIVDAASVGLPLVIANTPVEIYAVENENGFVFEPHNTNELREYLRILIYNEKTRKEMGHRSRLLVERRLNWRSIAIGYFDVYRHVNS